MKSDSWKGKNAIFFTYVVRLAHIPERLESTLIKIAGILKKNRIVENKTLKMTPFFYYIDDCLFFIVGELQGWKHVCFDEVVYIGSINAQK